MAEANKPFVVFLEQSIWRVKEGDLRGRDLGTGATAGAAIDDALRTTGCRRCAFHVFYGRLGRFETVEPEGMWHNHPVIRTDGSSSYDDIDTAKAAVTIATGTIRLFRSPTEVGHRKHLGGSSPTVGLLVEADATRVLLDRLCLNTVNGPRCAEVKELVDVLVASGKPFVVAASQLPSDPSGLAFDAAMKVVESVPYQSMDEENSLRAVGY
jgi:hypothetical protein